MHSQGPSPMSIIVGTVSMVEDSKMIMCSFTQTKVSIREVFFLGGHHVKKEISGEEVYKNP